MNKKGLMGKILILLAIILIGFGIFLGITVVQIYNLVKTIQTETANIQSNSDAIDKGNCSQLYEMESSIYKIIASTESSCKNPLIKITIDKIQQIPLKCGNLKEFIQTNYFEKLKTQATICANKTISIANSTSA